jgi:hypothetical protein
VPDLVSFVLTTGSLLALYKEPTEIREERVKKGTPPKERPINQGTMLLKLAFDLALRSDQAQEAVERLLPIQQGIGAKRGMELIAHTCNAL